MCANLEQLFDVISSSCCKSCYKIRQMLFYNAIKLWWSSIWSSMKLGTVLAPPTFPIQSFLSIKVRPAPHSYSFWISLKYIILSKWNERCIVLTFLHNLYFILFFLHKINLCQRLSEHNKCQIFILQICSIPFCKNLLKCTHCCQFQ